MNIQRATRHFSKPALPTPVKCAHQGHHHHAQGSLPRIREAYVDLPHAVLDLASDHLDSHTTGAASGAISALALARGFQNLQAGGLIHTIEGAGNLALAASSGLGAYQAFFGEHHDHGHHHGGLGLASGLEMAHGAAEMAVGALELKEGGRNAIGLTRILKGGSVLATHLIPGAAAIGQLVHLGAALAVTALDPKH